MSFGAIPNLNFDGFCPISTFGSHGGDDSADSVICRSLSQDCRSLNGCCKEAKVAAVERDLEGDRDLLCASPIASSYLVISTIHVEKNNGLRHAVPGFCFALLLPF